MVKCLKFISVALILFIFSVGLLGCSQTKEKNANVATILFTNDVESAYDPIPAFWLDDIELIGGLAEMTTLIDEIRKKENAVFLFDAGDIFTGALAKKSQGQLSFELMISMGYDAMAIGNHEFEYGTEIIAWEKNRAPFPVLGANLFYKGTDHPFAQAHAIIERNGIRIGVIGIMGQDAATAIIPSYIAPLDVHPPAAAVQKSVDAIRDEVDLVVLLTHQGRTAPMQTDAETDPRLARDMNADLALAGAVTGVDIMLTGHADAGTEEPLIHPDTGTIIMQTYGQGTYLGYLQVEIDRENLGVKTHDGKLIPVDAVKYKPNTDIREKIEAYRAKHADLYEIVGQSEARMNRRYFDEADVGNLFADIYRKTSGADIALAPPGSLRKDLSKGDVRIVDIVDIYPFVDDLRVMELSGAQLFEVVEQSLTFDTGLMQVSGIHVTYDLSKPERQRLIAIEMNGVNIKPDDTVTVAAQAFLAEGGDHYDVFKEAKFIRSSGLVSDILITYFRENSPVTTPKRGRHKEIGN